MLANAYLKWYRNKDACAVTVVCLSSSLCSRDYQGEYRALDELLVLLGRAPLGQGSV